MKKGKFSLEIFIDKIKVDEKYYYIDYHYILNNKTKKGKYENDYEGWTISQWENQLKKGYAIKCILEEITENYN